MLINGKPTHTIWQNPSGIIQVFDQRYFPHKIVTFDLTSSEDAFLAIREMVVRGAPLIGVTAAYGYYLACKESQEDQYLSQRCQHLRSSRPTAVNLNWALDYMEKNVLTCPEDERAARALGYANHLKQIEVDTCYQIGIHALPIIEELSKKKNGQVVNILTHCNAGWLACIDWGTATSPIYQAHEKGIKVHVWVDETRPRNQGANLTAFELGQQGVPHTLIVDNAGGHLMQHGMVDIVITGTDRTTRTGDAANKIGTYLKALAAHDNNIPFYIALPSSTIDWRLRDGLKEIPIEERDQNEVKYIQGQGNQHIENVLICPENTVASNFGFDVTPARLITGFMTERGVCDASEKGLLNLFPEQQ